MWAARGRQAEHRAGPQRRAHPEQRWVWQRHCCLGQGALLVWHLIEGQLSPRRASPRGPTRWSLRKESSSKVAASVWMIHLEAGVYISHVFERAA